MAVDQGAPGGPALWRVLVVGTTPHVYSPSQRQRAIPVGRVPRREGEPTVDRTESEGPLRIPPYQRGLSVQKNRFTRFMYHSLRSEFTQACLALEEVQIGFEPQPPVGGNGRSIVCTHVQRD